MKLIAECAIILLLAGCAEDNPFTADTVVQPGGGADRPHIDAAGTESGGAGSTQLSDMDPETPGIQDAVTLHISCSVADVHGNLFDGNNDGLGGTPEEDDWWGVL